MGRGRPLLGDPPHSNGSLAPRRAAVRWLRRSPSSRAADAATAARAARASASALDLSSASRTALIAAALAGMSFSLRCSSAGSAPLCVERGGEGGVPGVGDLGLVEVERPELLQPSRRQRQRTCRWRRLQEGGEALVAKRVATETEMLHLQRGPPPQGRREGHQPLTSPALPMAASLSQRTSSRGRAPRSRAAASAEAPASPTCRPPLRQ